MNDPVPHTAMTPAARIGIRGLPNLTDNMMVGGLYVLIAETPSARFPILAGSLACAVEDGLMCTVVVPAEPELFIQRMESYGDLQVSGLLATNRLQFFITQEEFSKKMFRFGADSFVRELEQYEIPANSYLVFNQADDLLSLHDISQALDQLDILRKWCAQQKVTILLVFSRATETESSTLNALMDNLTGIARLGSNKDGLELTFDYWQSPEGTIAARNYRLVTLDSGLYEVSNKVATQQTAGDDFYARPEEAESAEPTFFYMDPDLGSLAKQMPGVWQRVDTLVGLMHATRNTRSSTSILSFQNDTNLRQLAETVHTLRLSLGPRARIVVQEKGTSLRYQNEALLLRLGVNLVVNRDVPTSRLPLLLDSLKGQIFSRDVNINFEAALASVLPTRVHGYLAPTRFVREVDGILEQAETLNIPCAMVIGKPSAGTTITDVLTNNRLSRPGDLISADGEYCYLFLNACPQSAMLLTLERILGIPVEAVFDDVRFMIQREEIQAELPVLLRAAEQGNMPDYSYMMAVPSPSEAANTSANISSEPAASQPLVTLPLAFTAPPPLVFNRAASSEQRVAPPVMPQPRVTPDSIPSRPAVTSSAASAVSKLSSPVGSALRATDIPADQSRLGDNKAPGTPPFGRTAAPRAARSTPHAV